MLCASESYTEDRLIVQVSKWQSDIRTLGRSTLDEWSAHHRGRYLHNTQQEKYAHTLSGIRTRDPSYRAVADRTASWICLAWYYWHSDQYIFLEIYDTRPLYGRIILRHVLKSELFGCNIRALWKHLHKQDYSDGLVISLVVRFTGRGRVIFQLPYFTPLCYLD
jgi:hypothetical protein